MSKDFVREDVDMPKRRKVRKSTHTRAPRGHVGLQTYDQVQKVVAKRNVPLVRAFQEVAKNTGRTVGTIAVTYYRISKQKRLGKHPGIAGNPSATNGTIRGRRAKRGSGRAIVVKAVMSRVARAMAELESVITQQAREIERLRGESKLAERIRKALEA